MDRQTFRIVHVSHTLSLSFAHVKNRKYNLASLFEPTLHDGAPRRGGLARLGHLDGIGQIPLDLLIRRPCTHVKVGQAGPLRRRGFS
jgi:hypothetical protein